jgi:hypothetical protein
MDDNAYKRHLAILQEHGPGGFHEGVRDIGDTALMARVWLEAYMPAFTAADVVALAALMFR